MVNLWSPEYFSRRLTRRVDQHFHGFLEALALKPRQLWVENKKKR